MKFSLPIARNAWFKIALILTGLCCSLGEAAASSKKPSISEDALGFGEGGAEQTTPTDGPSRPKAEEMVPLQGASKLNQTTPIPSRGYPAKPEKKSSLAPNAPTTAGGESGKGGVGTAASVLDVDTSQSPNQLMKMSREELFQKIFQKPLPARLQDLVVYLVVDNENLEQIRVHWDEKFEEFRFRSAKLKSYLDTSLLLPDEDRARPTGEEYSGTQLKERRFGVQLDETEFLLFLTIPPELKKRKVRSLDDASQDAAYGVRIEPAKFSAYLNSEWENAWLYRERFFSNDSARLFWQQYNGSQGPERQPWNADLAGAIRVWDWVLMGNGSVSESNSPNGSPVQTTRRETKLVHDFVPWNSRLTLLDVSPMLPGGNISVPPLLGVDLGLGNKLYARRGSEKAKVDVFLSRPAGVTVNVNGEPVRTMQMGSGSQTVEGIPGRPGLNVGDVQIVYGDGQVEHVPFEFTQSSPEVLPEGRQEGSFSAGMRRIGPDEYGATPGDFLVAGSYLRGVSPYINGEFALAATRGLQVVSVDFLWIDDFVTTWNVISTFSLDSSLNWGQRHDLQYALKVPHGSLLGRASYIQSNFRSSFFTPVSRQKAAVETGLNVSGSIWKGTLAADISAQFNRKLDSTTTPIDYRMNLSYSLQAHRGLNLRASAGFTVTGGEYAPALSVTANYFFNAGRHSFYAINQTANQKQYVAPKLEQSRQRDTLLVGGTIVLIDRDTSKFIPGSYENTWRNQSTAGWSWAQGVGMVGGRSVSLAGSYTPDQYGLQFSGQKTANFADFGATYNLSDQSRQDIMSRSHYALGRMSTSLMFADGVFAIGRPVREGFLLVKGKQDLAKASFRINPSGENASEYSRGGPWSAASYGMISAYQTENVQVVPDHALGAVNMDGNAFTMNNTYQQGYVLRLGRPIQVFLRLRLIDQANLPLRHTTFQVFAVVDTTIPIYRSFSSEDGVIQIGGLEPGKQYLIKFGEDAFVKDLHISIPKSASRVFDMGDQKVENQSLSQLSKISMVTMPDPLPEPATFGSAGGQTSLSPRDAPTSPPGKAVN